MATDLIDRRALLAGGGAAAALATGAVRAQSVAFAAADRFPIWPGRPPGEPEKGVADVVIQRSPRAGDLAWTSVGTPTLTVARPARPNGGAVLVVPGGGYLRVATRRESSDMAREIAARGYTVFELLYRLPHDGWAAGPDAPLQDAQRAVRVIRAGAGKRWTVDPAKVGVLGFSAGGHLAARLATRSTLATYPAVDAADREPAKVAAAGLFYPVVTMFDESVHGPSRRELLGTHAGDRAWQERYSAQVDVPADATPCFVSTNIDDRSVPPRNSILMHEALRAAGVTSELHIFERGGHGPPAPRRNGKPVPWLDLFFDWAGDHGLPG